MVYFHLLFLKLLLAISRLLIRIFRILSIFSVKIGISHSLLGHHLLALQKPLSKHSFWFSCFGLKFSASVRQDSVFCVKKTKQQSTNLRKKTRKKISWNCGTQKIDCKESKMSFRLVVTYHSYILGSFNQMSDLAISPDTDLSKTDFSIYVYSGRIVRNSQCKCYVSIWLKPKIWNSYFYQGCSRITTHSLALEVCSLKFDIYLFKRQFCFHASAVYTYVLTFPEIYIPIYTYTQSGLRLT